MRKFPVASNLKRPVERFAPKVELIIACEGKNTEPQYVRDCAAYYGAGLVSLRVISETGVPLTVVRAAVEEKRRLLDSAKTRASRGLPNAFSVWAIFDKDDHEVDEAFALANEHKIQIAFSNPCFELWPVLHLQDYGAQDGRHELQRMLRGLMPRYDHQNGAVVDFDLIKDSFPLARTRAEKLNRSRSEEDCANGRPSTTVGELVVKIVQNGKFNFKERFER